MIHGIINFVRRKIAFPLLLFSVFLLLIGCQRPDEEIIVEYWTHADDKREELETGLIALFEKENPDIKIERRVFSSSELLHMIPSSIEAGEGPVLFNLPSEEVSSLLYSDALAPVDASLFDRSLFIDGVFDAVTKDGDIYGIPREFTNWCLYVNTAALEEAGLAVPRTWEDIVHVAQILTEYNDGVIEKRAFDFRYPYYLSFFIPMVEQLGGSLIGPDGSYIYGDDAWIKALSFMQLWGPNGLNLGSPTLASARSLFNSEECLMCLSGLYQEERIREQNPEFFESRNWAVFPFPVFEESVSDSSSAYYMQYFLVNANKSSKEQRAGWLFAAFILEHAEEYLDEVGLVMPLKSIVAEGTIYSKPFGDVFAEDLGRSHAVYSGEYASEIQSLLGEAIDSVMLYSASPEQAAAQLRASVNYLFSH